MNINHIIVAQRSTKTILRENVLFNSSDIERYLNLFEDLTKTGYIIGSFKDSTWKIKNFNANKYLPITFDLDVYRDIQLALKCFVTAQLTIGKRSDTVIKNQMFIKDIIFKTKCFEDIESYESIISESIFDDRKTYLITRAITNFLSFYPLGNSEKINEISNSVESVSTNSRELPHFYDVLTFDAIINDYFNSTSIENHMKYIIIKIWWALSNIIPIRATEFLLLKMNCITTDNNKFSITVPRIKEEKQSSEDINIVDYQTFEISEELYHMISEFQIRLRQKGFNTDYLFSYDFYQTTYDINSRGTSENLENRMNRSQLRYLIHKFYDRVVEGVYNEVCEFRIMPAHTRHFAIINMFLQGFNILSIKKYAYHFDMKTADNYYSHAKTFANSYVYNFIMLGLSDNIGRKMSDGLIGWRRNVINKGKIYSSHDLPADLLRVDYGYCKDKLNFPNNCGDCRPCPYFIFKPNVNEYDEAIRWLENFSISLEKKIELTVETMINTSTSIGKLFSPTKDEMLKSNSVLLQSYLDSKIRTDLILQGSINND